MSSKKEQLKYWITLYNYEILYLKLLKDKMTIIISLLGGWAGEVS